MTEPALKPQRRCKPNFATMPHDKLADAMGDLMADMISPVVEKVIRHKLKQIAAEIVKNISSLENTRAGETK